MQTEKNRPPAANSIIEGWAKWPICYQSGWAIVRKAEGMGFLVVKIGAGKWFAKDLDDALEQALSWERYCIQLQGWASLSICNNSNGPR